MPRLIERLNEGRPLISVSFDDTTASAERIAVASAEGADLFELRVDQFHSVDVAHVLAVADLFRGLPVVATIRISTEGGNWSGTEAARKSLFHELLTRVDAIDIEHASRPEMVNSLVADALRQSRLVMLSRHDFTRTLAIGEMRKMAADAWSIGAHLFKVACTVSSYDDLKVLARFLLEDNTGRVIVVGMGSLGSASRVFFPALGSRITYAWYGGRQLGTGQVTLQEAVQLIRRFYPKCESKQSSESRIC